MKPAVDEMFPEGAGPYVDLDEVSGGRRAGGGVRGLGLCSLLTGCRCRQGEARGC